MTRDIQVLLSTYNGHEYLGELLASLRTQTVADRMLVLVRDDGSTDDTLSVLHNFDSGPLQLEVVAEQNIGVRSSFLRLTQLADDKCQVFLFADQDDVWLPEKCEIAAREVARLDAKAPGLYCGRSQVTDADLNPTWLTDPAPKGPSLRNALVQNIAGGHTMAFNAALLDLFRRTMDPHRVVMHDYWAYALAAGLGNVVFDGSPHVLYRMHGDNELGYAHSRTHRVLLGFKRLVSLDRSKLTRQARALYEAIGPDLDQLDRAALAGFLCQRHLVWRIRYLLRFPLVYQTTRFAVVPHLMYLLGRFKERMGECDEDARQLPDTAWADRMSRMRG